MNVIYRSQCMNGKVLDGKCEKYATESFLRGPCEGENSCSLQSQVCVRGYCHEKCTNTWGQKCITVDGSSILWDESCYSFEGYKCEAFGDKFCVSRKCENRIPQGGACKHDYNLDECGGDRVQKCHNSRCIPTCLSDSDCGSGEICDRYGQLHGVCIERPFPDWIIGVIVFFSLLLLIATCVIVVKIKRKRKEKKKRLADVLQKPFTPYSPIDDVPAQSNVIHSSQFDQVQSFVPYSPPQLQSHLYNGHVLRPSNFNQAQQYGQIQAQQSCFPYSPPPLQSLPNSNSNNYTSMNNDDYNSANININEPFPISSDLPNYSASTAIINPSNNSVEHSSDFPNYMTSSASSAEVSIEPPHYIDCSTDPNPDSNPGEK